MIRPFLLFVAVLAFASSHAQTWTSFASVPNGFVSDHSLGFALEGSGYLVAGQTPNGYSDNVYKYNPDIDTWSTLADFPGEGIYHWRHLERRGVDGLWAGLQRRVERPVEV